MLVRVVDTKIGDFGSLRDRDLLVLGQPVLVPVTVAYNVQDTHNGTWHEHTTIEMRDARFLQQA